MFTQKVPEGRPGARSPRAEGQRRTAPRPAGAAAKLISLQKSNIGLTRQMICDILTTQKAASRSFLLVLRCSVIGRVKRSNDMRKILKDAHFQNASCNLFVSVVLLGGVLISLKFNLDSFRFPSYILGMLIT